MAQHKYKVGQFVDYRPGRLSGSLLASSRYKILRLLPPKAPTFSTASSPPTRRSSASPRSTSLPTAASESRQADPVGQLGLGRHKSQVRHHRCHTSGDSMHTRNSAPDLMPLEPLKPGSGAPPNKPPSARPSSVDGRQVGDQQRPQDHRPEPQDHQPGHAPGGRRGRGRRGRRRDHHRRGGSGDRHRRRRAGDRARAGSPGSFAP